MCYHRFCWKNRDQPALKLLQNIPILNICLKEKISKTPIPRVRAVFTDGSGNSGKAAITWQENEG